MRTFSALLIAAAVLLCAAGCQKSTTRQDANMIEADNSQARGPFLYCDQCGMTPAAQGTKCPVNNHSHDFRKAGAGKFVVCDQCGAAPSSTGTKCPVNNHSHDFLEF